jgi:hypothetical protein
MTLDPGLAHVLCRLLLALGLVGLTWPGVVGAQSQDAFTSVRYHIEATYDPATHDIEGQATISAVWNGAEPLTALYLFLPPNTLSRRDPREPAAYADLRYAKGFDAARLTVHRVTNASGQALPFQLQDDHAVSVGRVPDQALLYIHPPMPYAVGERFSLTMTFTTRIPEAKNWGHYHGIVALDGDWYPMLVPHRQGQWVWGMQEFVHAHYELRFTTHAEQQVVASTPWHEKTRSHRQRTFTGSAGPLYHLGLSLSPAWQSTCDTTQQPTVCFMALPRDQLQVSGLVSILRDILAFYRREFAVTVPENRFVVVVHERDLSLPFSAVADQLLFLSRDLVRMPALVRKLAEFYLARGVAQQQWGLRTAYHLDTSRWIGEGLSTYFALRWLDEHYGPGRNFLTWKGAWLPNFAYRDQDVEGPYRRLAVRDEEQVLTTPLSTSPDQLGLRFLQEKKGALIYSMLHDQLGPAAFRTFLRRLAGDGEAAVVTTDDVQRAAEAVSGQDLSPFFQQWVHQIVRLDYAVGQVEITPETDAQGRLTYVNRVEIRRLGDAVMPVTIRLQASDGAVDESRLSGTDRTTHVTWRHTAPLSDVQIDPRKQLPDVYRLNNTSRIAYAVRPLIDFPHPDSYLLYPFVTLETNFIDGNMPRVSFVARYLDDQAAVFSVGSKESPNRISLEGQLWRQRFPHPDMTTGLSVSDRLGARRVSVDTSLTLDETHQQYRIPANRFTLGYQVAFLEEQETFQGDPVPADTFPSTGRLHSLLFGYERDVRVPPAAGAPVNVLAEPLAYGYALRLQVEIASKYLGSTEPDFQQLRWEASDFLRLGNQTWLQLRVFGGWSAGTVPFQSKLSLSGVQTVRGYPYRLQFLGDRLLGGTVGLRFPLLRDVRLEMPGRLFALRSVHLSPFIDAGWRWDIGESLTQKSLRSGVGLRLIVQLGLASLFRFETAVDIAHPLDAQGRREGEGLQVWLRFQSTARAGVY